MRMAGVAMVVVLVGLFAWWLSGPAPRKSRAQSAQPAANPFAQPSRPLSSSGNLAALAERGAGWGSGTVSTFPVRAPEPDIYTAVVGDGPVSESGPGSVTELYPPSRVSYITTTTADSISETAPAARPRDPEPEFRPLPRGETPPPSGRDHGLDAAIEGAPGQLR